MSNLNQILMTPDEFLDLREGEALTHKYYATLGGIIFYCLENDIRIEFYNDYYSAEYIKVCCDKEIFHRDFVIHKSLLNNAGELCIRLYEIIANVRDECEKYKEYFQRGTNN